MGNTGTGGNTGAAKEPIDFTNFIQHANHPCVVLFTLLFKAIAVTMFIVFYLLVSNEALSFIIIVMCAAFDFWFVKNVSGR